MLGLALLFLAVYSVQVIWRAIPEDLSVALGYANYAIWWAFVTVTTVGYGDIYPVTTEGRIVAGALMMVGISVLGAVTATAASWLIRASDLQEDEIEGRDQKILAANQERLAAQISELEKKIDSLIESDRDRGSRRSD